MPLAPRKPDAVDVVIPPVHVPYFGRFIDLNMLVMTGDLERTGDEFSQAFAGFGLPAVRVVHTDSPISILGAPRLILEESVLTHTVVTQSGVVCSCAASAPCPTMTVANTDSREWNSRDVSHASRSPRVKLYKNRRLGHHSLAHRHLC